MLLGFFITYKEILFVQNVDLRNKSFEKNLLKNEIGIMKNLISFDFNFNFKKLTSQSSV